MKTLQPKDIIAILVLISVVFLLFNKIDGPLTSLIPLVVGYYFGHRKSGNDSGL